ncbi:MAG: aspartyl protease family protein [Chitinophagaceae bacterium]
MKMIKSLFYCIILGLPIFISAQKLPTLKTNVSTLSIKEGNSLYKNIWNIDPQIKLDTFFTNAFKVKQNITFYSDIDSLSFVVKPNKKYNFVVLLSNKQKVNTQINTEQKHNPSLRAKLKYINTKNPYSINDTIKFQIENDNRVYFWGSINGSDSLKILFDLNAGINVISKQALEKVNVKIDSKEKNVGSDGISYLDISNENKLKIGALVWDKIPLLVVPYEKRKFDAVFGWPSLDEKIFEIDYNNNIITIRKNIPETLLGYSKLPVKFINGNPFVKCAFIINGKVVEAFFGFDTGSNGEIDISQNFAAKNNLNGLMKQTGMATTTGSSGSKYTEKIVELPILKIGDFELYNVPLGIYDKDPDGVVQNEIIGNNILKRFNVIFDLQNSDIYIKPNHLYYSPLE